MKNWICPIGNVLGAAVLLLANRGPAQSLTPSASWHYQLTDGSQLVDDCPICDRVPFTSPARGSFELLCLDNGPLFSHYALEKILFETTSSNIPHYTVTGSGWLEIGGQLAIRQTLTLTLLVSNELQSTVCFFTNSNYSPGRRWPMLQLSADQTNGTSVQQIHLDLNAAPLREIWVSTTRAFKAGIWNSPTNGVGDGDLISCIGHVVKSNQQLTARFGIMPPVPDLGLGDIDILPHGEVLFSIQQAAFSETLGEPLRPGDLLSSKGVLVCTNQQLIARFQPDPPMPEGAGLAAITARDNGEKWFSVRTNFVSKALGRTIQRGALLSDSGYVVRDNTNLIAAFGPVAGTGDTGLRAAYVWPGGELWFITEKGFAGSNGANYSAGDLLSDQGYVVFRNGELLSSFAPADPSPELDAVFVVSDTAAVSRPPTLNLPRTTNSPPASLAVEWQGNGKVFQVEVATNVEGPFVPVTMLTPDEMFVDAGAQTNRPAGYYRVRQW